MNVIHRVDIRTVPSIEPYDDANYLSFKERMIVHAPLNALYFKSESNRVNSMIGSFDQRMQIKLWIMSITMYLRN